MNNPSNLLTIISQKLQPLCIASEIFPPDKTNNFYTLAAQFESAIFSKLKFDCNIIPGPEPEDDSEVDMQMFSVIKEDLQLENLRDVIWTITKINFVMPFGHFGVNMDDRIVYWKFSILLNLNMDEENQATSVIKRLKRSIEYIEDMGKTINDVATGKELPSKALKNNKWAQFFK
ncbi:hypothetical protein N9933_02445 [bacterium]|nr:hypothetical protein [bacterium]